MQSPHPYVLECSSTARCPFLPAASPQSALCSPALQVYTIHSILFIVFIILLVVTAFITVALTYFQLAVEDHRWWWRSFLCGGSTGFFILAYCFYYYHARCAAPPPRNCASSGRCSASWPHPC
jgi:hypothetical protein